MLDFSIIWRSPPRTRWVQFRCMWPASRRSCSKTPGCETESLITDASRVNDLRHGCCTCMSCRSWRLNLLPNTPSTVTQPFCCNSSTMAGVTASCKHCAADLPLDSALVPLEIVSADAGENRNMILSPCPALCITTVSLYNKQLSTQKFPLSASIYASNMHTTVRPAINARSILSLLKQGLDRLPQIYQPGKALMYQPGL